MLLGLYFVLVRPPLLPEDPRSMGTSLAQIQATVPGVLIWIRRVFWVMGGYMFATGLLTVYVALTAFRRRTRGVTGIVILAGVTSIGWMAVVNFLLISDFRWLILVFFLLWPLAVGLYCVEGRGHRSRETPSRR